MALIVDLFLQAMQMALVVAVAPKTRRIGMAKLDAVYWVCGASSGKPQSQMALRRVARVARRWIANAVRLPAKIMKARMMRPL